jgi:hypothetical protein
MSRSINPAVSMLTAIQTHDLKLLTSLLNSHIDPNIIIKDGKTPLECTRDYNIATLLLKKGAKIPTESNDYLFDFLYMMGRYMTMHTGMNAIPSGSLNTIRLILSQGCPITYYSLTFSIHNDYKAIFDLLLESENANPSILFPNPFYNYGRQFSILDRAIQLELEYPYLNINSHHYVKRLLAAGATVSPYTMYMAIYEPIKLNVDADHSILKLITKKFPFSAKNYLLSDDIPIYHSNVCRDDPRIQDDSHIICYGGRIDILKILLKSSDLFSYSIKEYKALIDKLRGELHKVSNDVTMANFKHSKETIKKLDDIRITIRKAIESYTDKMWELKRPEIEREYHPDGPYMQREMEIQKSLDKMYVVPRPRRSNVKSAPTPASVKVQSRHNRSAPNETMPFSIKTSRRKRTTADHSS